MKQIDDPIDLTKDLVESINQPDILVDGHVPTPEEREQLGLASGSDAD